MQTKIFSLISAIALVLGLVGANVFQSVPVALAAAQYATHIVANTSFDNGTSGPGNANDVLGAPNGQIEDFDGQPGFVTVGFASGLTIVDGQGHDLVLYLKDFSTVSEGGGPEDETFTLLGSADGSNFVPLVPTFRSPSGPAVHQLHAFGYDIAGNLPSVKYVKVQNLRIADHPFEGPDIDAFEAVNYTFATPTPTPDKPECSDFVDNDGDGKIDYPADSGCHSPNDDDERDKPECSDGRDNDGDGKVDEDDPGCHTDGDPNDGDDSYRPNHDDERDQRKPECFDRKDNDGDGLEDEQDPGCHTDGDATDGDDTFNKNDDDESDRKHVVRKPAKVVKAAKVVVPAAPVAVTAKTGAGAIGLMSALTGLTGLAISLRKFIK